MTTSVAAISRGALRSRTSTGPPMEVMPAPCIQLRADHVLRDALPRADSGSAFESLDTQGTRPGPTRQPPFGVCAWRWNCQSNRALRTPISSAVSNVTTDHDVQGVSWAGQGSNLRPWD